MEFITLFLIALGLSMDAFAVSVSNGLYYNNFKKTQAFYSSLTFGMFQGIMPAIGYFAGSFFSSAISVFDHWIALLLLGYIGGNMIFETIRELKEKNNENKKDTYNLKTMFLQGIATSIDALAVGISFAVMNVNVTVASSFICVITFLLSYAGSLAGKKFGHLLREKAKFFGGTILIIIGLKIFIEHIFGL